MNRVFIYHRVMIKQMMTYDEAADYLKVSPRTVRRLVSDGKLGVIRVSYKNVVIPSDDIEKFLNDQYERQNGAKVG